MLQESKEIQANAFDPQKDSIAGSRWEAEQDLNEADLIDKRNSMSESVLGSDFDCHTYWESVKWVTLVAGCWAALCSGHVYAFGVWSEYFQDKLSLKIHIVGSIQPLSGIDNTTHGKEGFLADVNDLFQFAVIGNYLPFAGFVYHRFGLRSTFYISSALTVTGYGTVYIVANSLIEAGVPRVNETVLRWLLYFSFFCFGHGAGYGDCAFLAGNMKNFRSLSGSVAGLLKGFYGLSASVLALVHLSGIGGDNFILFLALLGLILLVCGRLSTEIPEEYRKETHSQPFTGKLRKLETGYQDSGSFEVSFEKKNLSRGYIVEFILLVILLSFSILQAVGGDKKGNYTFVWRLATFLVLLYLLGASLSVRRNLIRNDKEPRREYHVNSKSDDEYDKSIHFSESKNGESQKEDISLLKRQENVKCSEDKIMDYSLYDALRKPEFWLLFVNLAIGMGTGLTIMSIAARLCIAKYGEDISIDLFVSLLSISNCFGRLLVGWAMNRSEGDKVALSLKCLCACLALMAASQLLLYVSNLSFTFIAAVFIGTSYGGFWTLNPTLVMALFGESHFGKIYACMNLAPTVGSILLSKYLSSYVYSMHANQQDLTCVGNKCYGLLHLLLAAACGFGSFCGFIMWHRLSSAHSRIIFERV